MLDYLPLEISQNILFKLSLQCLIICTSVCKSWKSMIKNSNFIQDHLTFKNKYGPPLLLLHCATRKRCDAFSNKLIKEEMAEFYSVHYDNHDFSKYYDVEVPIAVDNGMPCLHAVGTCNGLVCIADDLAVEANKFIICNPLIRKSVTLPVPNFRIENYDHTGSPLKYNVSIGFGYDAETNDYKVVRLVTLLNGASHTVAEVYSLATGSWSPRRRVNGVSEMEACTPQAFVNGILHWLAIYEAEDAPLGFLRLEDDDWFTEEEDEWVTPEMSRKKMESEAKFDAFPLEIRLDIFHRLPIKSLIRCTAVRKAWRSVIRNPSFIRTHLRRTMESNDQNDTHLLWIHGFSVKPTYAFYYSDGEDDSDIVAKTLELYSLHYDNPAFGEHCEVEVPSDQLVNECFRVVATCNGLVCLADDLMQYCNTHIYLANPSIRKFVTLPEPNVTYRTHGGYDASIGFAFDAMTSDYKVLRLVTLRDEVEYSQDRTVAEVFSLATGCWSMLSDVTHRGLLRETMMPESLEGGRPLTLQLSVSGDGKSIALFHLYCSYFCEDPFCDIWTLGAKNVIVLGYVDIFITLSILMKRALSCWTWTMQFPTEAKNRSVEQ
ncbi:hypothetical protein ACLB2K_021643 [Fragaria x ananassa]